MKYVEIGFKIFLDYFLEINLFLSIIYNGFLANLFFEHNALCFPFIASQM